MCFCLMSLKGKVKNICKKNKNELFVDKLLEEEKVFLSTLKSTFILKKIFMFIVYLVKLLRG